MIKWPIFFVRKVSLILCVFVALCYFVLNCLFEHMQLWDPHEQPKKSPPVTHSAWTANKPKKCPDFYEAQRDVYKSSRSCSPFPIFETVSYKTITLLTTDIKTRRLIGVSRDVMEEAVKSLNIVPTILAWRYWTF